MPDKNQAIENNFKNYSAEPAIVEKCKEVKGKIKDLANFLDEECPGSREKSLAMTKLEECMFWANAAIARN